MSTFKQRLIIAYYRTYACLFHEKILDAHFRGVYNHNLELKTKREKNSKNKRDAATSWAVFASFLENSRVGQNAADITKELEKSASDAATDSNNFNSKYAEQLKSEASFERHSIYYLHPLSMIAVFFGWPVVPNKRNHQLSPMSLTNLIKNLLGQEDDAAGLKTLWNTFWALPLLVWHLVLGIFITGKNVIKLFTEFLPTILVNECYHQYKTSNNSFWLLAQNLFSIIQFGLTALTSPLKSFAMAAYLGNALQYFFYDTEDAEECYGTKELQPLFFPFNLIFIPATLLSLYISFIGGVIFYPYVFATASAWLNTFPLWTAIMSSLQHWMITAIPATVLQIMGEQWIYLESSLAPAFNILCRPLLKFIGLPFSVAAAMKAVGLMGLMGVYSGLSMIEDHVKLSKLYKWLTRIPYQPKNDSVVSDTGLSEQLKSELKCVVQQVFAMEESTRSTTASVNQAPPVVSGTPALVPASDSDLVRDSRGVVINLHDTSVPVTINVGGAQRLFSSVASQAEEAVRASGAVEYQPIVPASP